MVQQRSFDTEIQGLFPGAMISEDTQVIAGLGLGRPDRGAQMRGFCIPEVGQAASQHIHPFAAPSVHCGVIVLRKGTLLVYFPCAMMDLPILAPEGVTSSGGLQCGASMSMCLLKQ